MNQKHNKDITSILVVFYHPDCTVGLRISLSQPNGSRTITAGQESEISLLTLPQRHTYYSIVTLRLTQLILFFNHEF